MKITTAALAALLFNRKGAAFVRIVTATEPKMLVKHRETRVPNPFTGKTVLRIADRHGMIGASYQNAVNNRREAEGHEAAGEFRAESLWNGAGEHVEGCKTLVRHRTSGKVYMVFYPHRQDSVLGDVWTVDGEVVEKDALAPFLTASGGSKRQETETQVQWRVIALESLKELQLDGEVYQIVAE